MEASHDKVSLNLLVLGVFLPVGLVYTYVRFDIRIASACDAVAMLSGFTMVGAVLTYVGTYLGAGRPFVDATLLAADAALGFDWMAMLRWLDRNPHLAALLNQAYLSILYQVLVLVIALNLARQYRRLQVFVLALQIALIVCALAPAIVPAVGAYPFLGIVPELHHPGLTFPTMDGHVADVLRLRGDHPLVTLGSMTGIVAIPSFHMALAVLFAWAFWAVPILRWVALALNLAMAAATPIAGGHYLVDLVAGAVLAVAALTLAKGIARAVSRAVAADVEGPARGIPGAPALSGA